MQCVFLCLLMAAPDPAASPTAASPDPAASPTAASSAPATSPTAASSAPAVPAASVKPRAHLQQLPEEPDGQPYDLLIVNGSIIDGTGARAYRADLLIDGGIIVRILPAEDVHSAGYSVQAEKIVDARGRFVTPGFIDAHSHGDPHSTPRFDNFLSMGVTTISLGQDGGSPGMDNVAGWMDSVEEQGTGPNILHFTGHGTLRLFAGAPAEARIGDEVLRVMQRTLDSAMAAGSFGMTTGLEYIPGTFAGAPELVRLAEIVAAYQGLVMSHMRSEEDSHIEMSVQELLEQGRRSGAHVHVSHIKIVGANDPSRAETVLELLREARAGGRTVTADLYPYTASFTGIGILFPDWALPPNDYEEVRRTRRAELAEYLRKRVNSRNGPQATLIGTAPWAGMTLAEVADSLGKPFEEVLMDDIGPRGASAAYFVMNERIMRRFLQDPHVMISSDGSPTMRHPRGYGSFARIIHRYVHQERVLTLEEAVRKMSGLPAATFGLDDPNRVEIPRGRIQAGFAADLLIFDPSAVRDRATYEQPHRLAEGFDWVFVNGEAVIARGELNEQKPGTVIRHRAE